MAALIPPYLPPEHLDYLQQLADASRLRTVLFTTPSNDLRGDVLRVLGVLKVATADQIQRLSLSQEHSTSAR
ncbi:hypothetical protein ABT269_22465 [Streptomyces viridosporus]|uniref:hypothetical protein n=1 Tax=Streptomyces viridosporus TaxID=67581 RepID=UPI003319253B